MKRSRGPFPLVSALLAAALIACATHKPAAESGPLEDRELLTRSQLLQYHFGTAYDAVSSLRAHWLETRGPDSLRKTNQVWVYLNDTKLGGPETLQAIAIIGVVYIRYYDGITASGRWGLDHGQGVIYVSTR